jgi:hypothetical protein
VTRPFGLRDFGLLLSLRGLGLNLDMQRAALWRPQPLDPALAAVLPWRNLGTLTYVGRTDNSRAFGFVQVGTQAERREWQVIHLAPWLPQDEEGATTWVGLLTDLGVLAGQWGALRIRAGVVAGGAEEDAFRQAGFSVYAREEVYRLWSPRPEGGASCALRALMDDDAWALLQLAGQVVPAPVQQAEGMSVIDPSVSLAARLGISHEQGFVLPGAVELCAYAGLNRGPEGVWARILLHPEAGEMAATVVRHVIRVASPTPVLYCPVREYQSGLRGVLAGMGFEHAGAQVWMVKHTARLAEAPRFRHLAVLEKRAEAATTPLRPLQALGATPLSWMTRERYIDDYRRTDSSAIG